MADPQIPAPQGAGEPQPPSFSIERIYTKIGVSSRAEAAMFAMANDLIPNWESAGS